MTVQCAYCGKEMDDYRGINSCKEGNTGEPFCEGCKDEEID